MKIPRLLSLMIATGLLGLSLQAAPPPLREQVSLNGDWPEGGRVPTYTGIVKLDRRVYARDVDVPAAWKDRVIRVEFGAVNFIAEVSVNGELLTRHVGGWCPFSVDVTRHARPGGTFRLQVVVLGAMHPPVTDASGGIAWPVGGWRERGGIAEDVWLRAYGKVHITDAFIRTSVEKKRLEVDYTIVNASAARETVRIAADVRRASDGASEHRFAGGAWTLAPGETRTVTVGTDYVAKELYWPDRPSLYHLVSRVEQSGQAIDTETRRFGFREIAVRGNQFHWNGVRINLYGDYQVLGDDWYMKSDAYHTPENWPATADRMLASNMRVIRWHHNPVPQYLLDVCDEKGLLVCDESAHYARDFHKKTNQALYMANAMHTVEPWIRADRNHPSIYMWNATNEMTHDFCGSFKPEALVEFGRAIAKCDPTRPVGYDGDNGHPKAALNSTHAKRSMGKNVIIDSQLIDYHYPEGYNLEPVGSIYGWDHLVFPDKPTGTGEVLHTRSPRPEVQRAVDRNTWWLGIWMRGLRYTNWTNVKPACWWFVDRDMASSDPAVRQRSINLRNALAPVALFDKTYDDLGIEPYVTDLTPGGRLPTLQTGRAEKRTFILYNDEFRDTHVQVEVEVLLAGRLVARGTRTMEVPLGEHREFAGTLPLPAAPDGVEIALVLRTSKGGVKKFEEVRRFIASGGDPMGARVEASPRTVAKISFAD